MGKKIITTIVDDITGKDIDEKSAVIYALTWQRITPYPEDVEVTEEMEAELAGERHELYFADESVPVFHERYTTLTQNSDPLPLPEAKPVTAASPKKKTDPEVVAMREWWKGLDETTRAVLKLPEVSERGRIPDEVKTAYGKAKSLNAL